MENASKALIIAGAILLAILIIGLGMFIYNKAKGGLNGANMDQQKVAAYNGDFEQYEGTQSGTQVRALCDSIRNHNNSEADDPSLTIILQNGDASSVNAAPTQKDTAGTTATDINTIKKDIQAGKTYTITFGYDKQSGYIVACGIAPKQ